MITGTQIVCHLIGDYLGQSHWMATEKTKRSLAAVAHIATYGLPFLLLQPSLTAFAFIVGTHFVIDRWRLARYVVFAKNFIAPRSAWPKWADCYQTGFHKDVPPWLSTWLLIIVDNSIHIVLNAAALEYLNDIITPDWAIKALIIAIISAAIVLLFIFVYNQTLTQEEIEDELADYVTERLKSEEVQENQ